MFEPRDKLWDPLYDVLMKPTNGIVASLQDKVRFGFTSYRGSSTANDPACPNLFEVDYDLGNFGSIDTLYKGAASSSLRMTRALLESLLGGKLWVGTGSPVQHGFVDRGCV